MKQILLRVGPIEKGGLKKVSERFPLKVCTVTLHAKQKKMFICMNIYDEYGSCILGLFLNGRSEKVAKKKMFDPAVGKVWPPLPGDKEFEGNVECMDSFGVS